MKMNKFNFLVILLIAILTSCSDDKTTESQQLTKEVLSGFVQKGPFINGTTITISELDASLTQTGNTFNTQIIDNSGTFELKNPALSSPFLQLQADGFYFDEVIGKKSNAQLTLLALSNISNKDQINVNVLTHLEKGRAEFLINKGIEFNQAKDSAQHELLSAFGLGNYNIKNSEELDISVNNSDNAILIAISIILQANNSVADLTELLANINTDFRKDGVLNSEIIKSELFNNTQNLNLKKVRANLENRYSELGLNVEIADFESVIGQYLASQKPFNIDVKSSNVTCKGLNNGAINITINEGTEPFTYQWSNGASTEDVQNLAPGNYSVTITDANNYVLHKNNITISEPEILNASYSVNHATSINGTDGSITLSVTGGTEPYTYEWSNSETTANLQNLKKGFYLVNIKDSNLCTTQLEIAIQEPIELSIKKTDLDCFGDNQGMIDLSITGGLKPYSILWNNGSLSTQLTNLSANTYSVTVTDKLGYTIEKTVEIVQPNKLTITPNITHPSDNQKGIIKVEVSGGTEPYNYEWSNNTFNQNSGYFNNGEIFELTLVVTDKNNCSTKSTFKINNTYTDPRDGEVYPIVKIGNQIWMARNLNYDVGEGSWYYDDNNSNARNFGRLYTYDAAKASAPEGWHIASDEEWKILENTIGIPNSQLDILNDWRGTNQGNFLKSTELWSSCQGLNSLGLNITPGGYRGYSSGFLQLASFGRFRTSSNIIRTFSCNGGIYRSTDGGSANAFSVRCVKD